MPFDERALKEELARRGAAAAVFACPRTGSTNDDARRLAAETAGDLLVCADRQDAGRGSHERSFWSPADTGFYVTAALRGVSPALPVTLAAGVAALEALREICGVGARMKWVNDIRFAGKKAGGILCERTGESAVLVGLGLNLAAPQGGFPPQLREVAGALGADPACCNALAAAFFAELRALLAQPQQILPRYTVACETLGQTVRFCWQGGERVARAAALAADGALLLRDEEGNEYRLGSGECSVRPVEDRNGI